MRRGFAVVLVVGLISAAGFAVGGVSAPSDATGTAEPFQSMTPTTTAEGSNDADSSTDAAFPPGTSASGMNNATQLLRTHRSLLNDTTYATQTNVTRAAPVTDANGTFREFDVSHISIAAEKGTDATRVTFADENLTYENGTSVQSYWVSDEAVAIRTVDGSGERRTIMYRYSPTGRRTAAAAGWYVETIENASAEFADPSFLLRPYLLGLEYEYSGTVVRDDRTLYRFSSTEVNATAVERHDLTDISPSVERVESTVLVSERGVVRSFDVSVTRSRDDETVTTGGSETVTAGENGTVTAGLTYGVPRVGNVTSEPPRWFATQLPHLDASLSSDGTVVTVNHTGGASVSTADLLVYSSLVSASGQYDGTFDPGDTLYLYLTRTDTGGVLVSQNEPPEVNESFVRFEGENVSITPWRLVVEGGQLNRTTIEVEVRDGGSNRTVSAHDSLASLCLH